MLLNEVNDHPQLVKKFKGELIAVDIVEQDVESVKVKNKGLSLFLSVFILGNDNGFAAFHHCNTGVGCSEVNTDYLRH